MMTFNKLTLALAICLVTAPTASAGSDHDARHGIAGHAGKMRMSPVRKARAEDRAKADRIAVETGRAIKRYRDVAVAKRDGYKVFGDVPEARVIHYVHPRRSRAERRRLDPTRPGALLYQRRGKKLVLVGAMFTAPAEATPGLLDARVPLSQARWHLHTNICTPRPIWSRAKWQQRFPSGRMVFGTFSPISTREECKAVGGRFHETIFGWMVHVFPFRTDAKMRWHDEHLGH